MSLVFVSSGERFKAGSTKDLYPKCQTATHLMELRKFLKKISQNRVSCILSISSKVTKSRKLSSVVQ